MPVYSFIHNKILKYTHGAERYAAVAYSGCELFELHNIIMIVVGALLISGVGAIIYEYFEA